MNNKQNAFGKRIRELRKNKHITQEKLAELISVEPQQISRIENGACFTTFETLEKLAHVFNVPINKLFIFDHTKQKSQITNELIKLIQDCDEDNLRLIYKIVTSILN